EDLMSFMSCSTALAAGRILPVIPIYMITSYKSLRSHPTSTPPAAGHRQRYQAEAVYTGSSESKLKRLHSLLPSSADVDEWG
ncbi:unnamed protein product, partial [Mycena citricolor]